MVHYSDRSPSTERTVSHGNNRVGAMENNYYEQSTREHQTTTRASHPTSSMDDRSFDGDMNIAAERQDDTSTSSSSRFEKRPDLFAELRSLPCENRPHPVYAEWTGDECDHESFFCFSEGVNNNCCKCRPECCGQCNTLATFNDPYQACPVLSAKAYDAEQRSHIEQRELSTFGMILVAFGVAFLLGIIAGLFGHYNERRRLSMLIDKKHRERNLREYRDEGEADDGDYKDEPYR